MECFLIGVCGNVKVCKRACMCYLDLKLIWKVDISGLLIYLIFHSFGQIFSSTLTHSIMRGYQ